MDEAMIKYDYTETKKHKTRFRRLENVAARHRIAHNLIMLSSRAGRAKKGRTGAVIRRSYKVVATLWAARGVGAQYRIRRRIARHRQATTFRRNRAYELRTTDKRQVTTNNQKAQGMFP